MNDTRNRWVAEAVALVLPILILCAPFLFSPRCLAGREFQASLRSRAVYAQEMNSRDGEWPRWNGRQYAGTPFLGDLHGSLHYPPHLLYLWIPPERAIGFLFAFHMIVAAIGMYRLSRYFEFRRSAAVLGGVAYGVSFSVAAHMDAGVLDHYVAEALAPWVLLLILRMVKRVSNVRIAMLAVTIGGVLLGGSPQDVPPLILMSLGLILWTAVDARRRKRPWKGGSAVFLIAASGILGLALAAASLLPAFEVRRHAVPLAGPADIARDWRILYVGVLPSVVALLPFQAPKRGPVLFFAFSAVAALLPPLLFPQVAVCPLWVVALCLSGLAAAGWDGLARGRYSPPRVKRILAGAGAVVLVGAGLAYWRFRSLPEIGIVLFLFAVTAAIIARLYAHPRAILAAILVTAADLCFFDARAVRAIPPEEYDEPPWYSAYIGPERSEYRLLDLTTTDATPSAHGFRLLNGHGYPRPLGLDFVNESLEDLNVRWLVSAVAPPNDRWVPLGRKGDLVLYQNRRSRASAFIRPALHEPSSPLTIRRTANSIEVAGRSYNPDHLIVSESWLPGWKAYSQRREVPVQRGSNALLNIDVPSGDWHVTLRYEPDSYRVGRIVSSSAVALLIALLVAGMRRSKLAIS